MTQTAIPSAIRAADPRPPAEVRQTEDKIRQLCNQLVLPNDGGESGQIFVELRDALHQHIEYLRDRVAEFPVFRGDLCESEAGVDPA
jgi:hypothetical protein